MLPCNLDKLPYAMLFACSDHIVARLLLLQHQPLHFHIVARMPPVALHIQIAQVQPILKTDFDPAQRPCDFARDKRLPSLR